MLYVSICLTLLTLIAAMHLWAKTQKEQPNALYKWLIYLIVLVGFLILICQLTRGAMRMMHREHHGMMDKEMMFKNHHMMMMQGMHEDEDEDECCEGMKNGAMKEDCDEHIGKGMKEGEEESDDDDDGVMPNDTMRHHGGMK